MLRTFFIDNNISFLENEEMKNHTTFKVGGMANFVILPDDENKLVMALKFFKENNINYCFLGKGSNVLFKDSGFDGVVIKSANLNNITIDGNTAITQSGVTLMSICKALQEKGLSGLEFCYGIPGNVGGALYMNAGAYGGEISDCLESVKFIDDEFNIREISKEKSEFSYRYSIFQEHKNWFILEAKFNLKSADKSKMLDFMKEIMFKRKDKQPVEKPSAGSSFKRPVGHFAAALIDECGLKGFSVGDAQVSEKHAGFIVNNGNATCSEIVELAEKVEKIVFDKTGVKIEKEMIIM